MVAFAWKGEESAKIEKYTDRLRRHHDFALDASRAQDIPGGESNHLEIT